MSSQAVVEQFQKNKKSYLTRIKELVAIPSVSFAGFDQKEVERCAFAVRDQVQDSGFENIELIYIEDNHRPYVYADWLHAPGAPTLLLYAHYDVQPPGNPESWESPAFVATERNERLYGRGAADDKGGLMVHLATVQSWLSATGKLPINVKLLIEGEEESGSDCLDQLLEQYGQKLQADVIIIPDVENFDETTPGLTVSLRGIVAAQLEITALRQPLHSGMWGGAVPDPAAAMCKVLSTLIDDKGEIAIPAIREMAPRLTNQQREELASLPLNEEHLRRDAGLLRDVSILGDPRRYRERIWFCPALTINGVQASARSQASNIICDKAWAKVSIRTVSPMDKEQVFNALKEFIEQQRPFGLKVEVREDGLGDGWTTSLDDPAMKAMIRALEKAWGVAPIKMGCGGSIPFVKQFSDALNGAPALLIGVEDPQSRAHSANESLGLAGWEKSVISCIYLFEELSNKA